jgi:hypothetical protein
VNAKERIYVDASQPATLRHAGVSLDCLTLREAAIAWHKLPAEEKEKAAIKVNGPGGRLYKADEIARFHHGPKPAGD